MTDAKNDGLIDRVSASAVIDTDGDGATNHLNIDSDGIIDLFNDDFLGTGFLTITVVCEVISTVDLPDVDDDNVPDVVQTDVELAAALPEAVHTELAGSGCSISATQVGKEPVLPTTAFFAGLLMFLHRTRRRHD